jgi:glycosyltransferase involved in cell wall biosynthesis
MSTETESHRHAGDPTPSRFGVVYFGNEWFAENRTSSHHIARRLAQQVKMLYVDSPGMRPPSASGRDLRRIWNKLTQAMRLPEQVQPGLWHCTVPQLPWRKLPGAQRLNRWFGAWAVRRAMRHAGIDRAMLWFVVPHPSFMLDAIPHESAIYYCIDDYAAHPGVDVERIRACDAELTRRADHVFVAPPALVAAKQAVNPSTSYSPHGVDVELFAKTQAQSTPVPKVAAALSGPVVGYFGLIAAWTDVELIEYLAQNRPDWNFLLVGHASVDVSSLARLRNVTLVGPQPYESLPGWAKAFDVAIIPYRLNQQVRNANPLKLREYLATGKPVVSVATLEVERFGDLVRVAHGRESFLAQVELALADDDPNLRNQRMDAVRSMSWEHRAQVSLQTAIDAMHRRAVGSPSRIAELQR